MRTRRSLDIPTCPAATARPGLGEAAHSIYIYLNWFMAGDDDDDDDRSSSPPSDLADELFTGFEEGATCAIQTASDLEGQSLS